MEAVVPVHQQVLVVGVDGSAGAAHAVRWAALEAAATGSRLRLVSVWDVPGGAWSAPPGPYVTPEQIAEGARHIVQRAGHEVERVLGGPRVPVELQTVRRSQADGLLSACDDADLLIVGRRGGGGFTGLLLGSVARACAHRSDVPVAVIGPQFAEPASAPIVVGMDGSEGSEVAAQWAAAEADRLGAPEPTALRVAGASPVDALVEASKTASLLVLGSRGRGGFLGLVLGSVGQQCLTRSACPVVIVPRT